MRVLNDTIGQEGFPGGVIPGTDPTLLGPAASPRGKNSALALAYTGIPYPQKRMGITCLNSTPITGSPALIGQFHYYRAANDTHYHLLVSDTGRIDSRSPSDVITNITTALTAGTYYPDFAVQNDLAFIVNGQDKKKYNGTTLTAFGITRPTVGTMAGAAGAAGSPNGTYELRVTYANSSTGHESSASDTASATVVVASQKINVTNVPVSADGQVDTRYLYVRNTATQAFFYRAGTINDNVTTSITLDFVDANITTRAPSTSENDPPPSGVKYLAVHQGRMFAATDTALYYSKLDDPESFDPLAVEYVNKADGQKITGIISDHEILIIFKANKVYGIFEGNDPASWQVRLISSNYGCSSHRTIVSAGGWTLWWGPEGLARWNGSGDVDPIGLRLYGDPSDRIDFANILTASAAYELSNQRYMVSLPELGQTRATVILPFNIALGVFESDGWDPMDASSLGDAVDASLIPHAYLGNYKGQVFEMWRSNNDGIAISTTTTGTFVQSGTTLTTITDATATFDTTGGGLVERKVTLLDSNNTIITTTTRPRVLSNTGTSLTLASTISGLVDGATYTYIVGGPDFQWDTTWRFFDLPWVKKRFEYFFILFKGVAYGGTARVDFAVDWDDTNANGLQQSYATTSAAGTWDDPSTLWDAAVWNSPTDTSQRFRVARVGKSYRVRVRTAEANQPFAILYVGVQAVMETTKR